MYKKRWCSSKRSQIWIETVIYTLIGLAIIGLLISTIMPRVNEMKDKSLIGQSIDSLNTVNSKVMETLTSAGNTRQVFLSVRRGEYVIDSLNDSIYFILKDTKLRYSEPEEYVSRGDITVLTKEKKDKYDVYLILNYSYYNITYENKEFNRVLTPASTTYNLLIENNGGSDKQINIRTTI